MKALQHLYYAAAGAALIFALSASKCQTDTIIVPYVAEICNDNIDNDGDGQIDCLDSDCDAQCQVHVNINPILPTLPVDSLTVTGTHFKATGITVSVLPSGSGGGPAAVSGDIWSIHLTNLSALGVYTVTAVASDAQGRQDTATATFERKN